MRKEIEDLLRRAEAHFLQGDFDTALIAFGEALQSCPDSEEAKIGAFLSDMGKENEIEAQALFEYYHIIKEERDNAFETIVTLMDSIVRNTTEIVLEHDAQSVREVIEYGEGIGYEDFVRIVEEKGSFKRAFEDIIFSTKVIISQKEEFIDFVERLIAEGYKAEALSYLDGVAHLFGNDQEVLMLYRKAEEA